jgi:altronate dehydratase
VHDHGQSARQGHNRLLHSATPGDLHRPGVAVAAVLVIGLEAKQYFFPPEIAHAISSGGVNVLQIQRDVNMQAVPTQKLHDMTFVFDIE